MSDTVVVSRHSLLPSREKKNGGEKRSPEISFRARSRSLMMNQRFDDVRRKRNAAKKQVSRRLHPDRFLLHGGLEMHVLEARDLQNLDTVGLSDPYVTVDVCRSGRKLCRLAKTRIVQDSLNPRWGELFRLPLCYRADELLFTVKDDDVVSMQYIGFVTISAKILATGDVIEGWFDLRMKSKALFTNCLDFSPRILSRKPLGSLRVKLKYTPVSAVPPSIEVPGTVFPPREGCQVRLYQDAHTPAVPPVTDVEDRCGNPYNPHSLWVDIADAIEKAEKLIYIIGWSVKADLRLRRDGIGDELLGDVLKRKAKSGVRVLVMLWKEAMSTDLYPPGLMGTHDIETMNFFQGSEVEVLPAPRHKEKSKRMFEGKFVETAYTHHQKCVILDAAIDGVDGHSDRRRLIGFAGGLDLTDGRWDTPSHCLYSTLTNEHKDDCYNGVCPATVTTGPREPWHDIHVFVEGPVVLDLLTNFEQRWKRQGKPLKLDDKLLPIGEDFELDWQVKEDEHRWTVQLFRSIGSDSVHFDEATTDCLLSSKGRKCESSIQQAYIHQIRRAKRFIYIENQYFLGSSHGWIKKETMKCPHLIPLELTHRIIRAIEAGEDFRVYITIPLHPEGNPAGATVQEILRWQFRTIEFMYRKIGRAIENSKNRALDPRDYLQFFCLGKRESPGDVPATLEKPAKNSVSHKVRESLRFMIYVHSKFAVFDDEYVIVGSANINERSMAGYRDTEMALGAYQPRFTDATDGREEVKGDVRTFRLALWAEHCGKHMSEHLAPASSSCMHALKRVGDENLAKFISHQVGHSDSHLMTYPLIVTRTGHVFRRLDNNFGRFPDTGGSVKGRNSLVLPNSLTT